MSWRWAVVAILGEALVACAGERRPPAIPSFHGQPPGPPKELGEAPPAQRAAPVEAPAPTSAPLAESAAPPPAPQIGIAVEPPFRLDLRVVPQDKAIFLADLRERTRWNQGGRGTLASDPPPVPGHPAPKVIVDVTRVAGPHPAASVQAVLRKMFWSKVIECYALSAYKDQKLRGKAALSFRITREGRITGARAESSTFNDAAVTICLAASVQRVDLPKARAASQAKIEVQVSPGDEPVPPPKDLITPGEGTLAPQVIQGVIDAARPSFEACYRPALEYAPELWGRLGIRFHLTPRGKLDEAFEVESRFPDERVTLCVLRAARALKFPAPGGGDMRFIVPLRFWSGRSPVEPPSIPANNGSGRLSTGD